MRIAIFGLSLSSAWGNGQATAWRALVRGLHERGHEVTFYERDRPFYAARRDFTRLPWCRLRVYASWEAERTRALRQAAGCDVVVVGSYCAEGARIARDALALPAPRKVFYDLDTPVTLEGLEAGDGRVLEYLDPATIPEFDLYLSFSGGPILERLRGRWGARRAEALYLGVDPGAYAAAPGGRRWRGWRARLACLATYAADRWAATEELLLRTAQRMPEARFGLAGAQYPSGQAWPRNLRRWEHVAPGEHAEWFGAADFILNLTRAPMRRAGHSPQSRLFEAACCGVPALTDVWPGLEEFFEPGREILPVASCEDVCRHLRGQTRAQRDRIGWRARRRVLAHHTGARRARELEALLG